MNTNTLPKSLLPLAAVAALTTAAPAQDGDDWTTLFGADTENLDGWVIKSGFATYEIKDGAILGTTAEGSGNTFLCTEKLYGNFELTFEVKCDDRLNSGVQIRSTLKNPEGPHGGRINGPQVEIEASGANGAESGYIYGEAAGGWLTPEKRRKPHKHFKDGEWNSYKIVAQGPRIRTWINGAPIEDLTHAAIFETHPKGHIGLQVHGIGKKAGPMTVQWRDIKIKELGGGKEGAAIGGSVGAGAGALLGAVRAPEADMKNLAAAKPFADLVPGKRGFVFSPFANGKQVDVTGFPAGTEVRCPYTQHIFRTP